MSTGTKGPRQFQALGPIIPFVDTTVLLTAIAAAETTAAITVPGAEPGDLVIWGMDEDAEGGVISANVNATDTVEITLVNATASTITIAAATVYGIVIKTDGSLWQALGGRALGT